MYQPPSSLLHNTHFGTGSSAETAKSAASLMLDAFTSGYFQNFAACPPSASSSPFSFPSVLPQSSSAPAAPSNASSSHSLCSAPSVCSPAASSSSLPMAHPPPLVAVTGKRERTKYSEQQLSFLESNFSNSEYPDVHVRERIAKVLQLTDVKVQVWFKNRRAKKRQECKLEQMRTGAHCHGTGAPSAAPSTALFGCAPKGEKRRNGGDERTVTKREESVEDTEEENQQPPKKKPMSSRSRAEAEQNNTPSQHAFAPSAEQRKTSSPPAAAPSSSFALQLPYDLQKGLLNQQIDPFMYSSGSSLASCSAAAYAPTSSAEMGSLAAVASNFPPQVAPASFYGGGWPSVPSAAGGYASAAFLPSPYVPPAVGQVAPFVPTHAYCQQTTNNYYISNTAQHCATIAAAQQIELEPKDDRE